MRFVVVLAIETQAQSAENADFQGFLQFSVTIDAVLNGNSALQQGIIGKICHV